MRQSKPTRTEGRSTVKQIVSPAGSVEKILYFIERLFWIVHKRISVGKP
ncbi:hypothetical protein [Pseudomonas viridiflava]|nr:hypothetical protein [Pseudomonas viridiflava]MEE3926396.1 hypothetical protein [Pseudomonas viridiflava]MEE3932789.1 hypothetical protein [Pseudomonas viridiflava]MEE3939695.1 hypothetical protein [Pseudomonas viridiflava]MEE3969368.1 hypothetical protein [Pseudomonas viridiflava]MEE3983767.1 hypothetical protein [Pseudomonas viridiflava]